MLESVEKYTDTLIKTVKGMSPIQKAGAAAIGLGVLGAIFIMINSDEEVITATNVEVSDVEPEAVEEVEVEVASAE